MVRQLNRTRAAVQSLFSLNVLLSLCVLICFAATAFAEEDPFANIDVVHADPDFEVQGEYVGDRKAMQVIARGDGEFDLVIYEGGLPGAGAKPTEPRRLESDADVVADLVDAMEMEKTIRKSPTLGAKPPAGAVILFDGTADSAAANWVNGRIAVDGSLKEGATTKQNFGDYRLHVEFRTPFKPLAIGQDRGNSGIYHQGRYETQILDSFGLEGADNETGGIYSVSAPSVNACFPPMSWQTYDVQFTAAKFGKGGKKSSDARITVRLNGVLVQSDVEVPQHTRAAPQKESAEPGPIHLQAHGNPVRFRNVWIVPIDAAKEARRPTIPGFERFFAGTSEPSVVGGELLITSLACNACHAGESLASLPDKRGPLLTNVTGRLRADAIVAMISDPHAAKSNTTMPDPWSGLTATERKHRGLAIASYLDSFKTHDFEDKTAPPDVVLEGYQLYHRIGCVACHRSFDKNTIPASTTVSLDGIEKKYSLPALQEFLQKPHHFRSGTRMPRLAKNDNEAYLIAAYLLRSVVRKESSAQMRRRVYRGEWQNLPDFDQHEAVSDTVVSGFKIDDIEPKQSYGVVFDGEMTARKAGGYVFDLTSDDGSRITIGDETHSHDGIHAAESAKKKIILTEGVHPFRVEYFQEAGEAELSVKVKAPGANWVELSQLIHDPNSDANLDLLPSQVKLDPALAAEGKAFFEQSGCANCHQVEPSPTSTLMARSLEETDPAKGCLASDVSSPAVDFNLNPTQRSSIAAALVTRRNDSQPEVDDELRVHMTMAALNCYACHDRHSIGGPEAQRDKVFQTTAPEMGLEGRLPPSLSGVGDKLSDEYFKKIFNEGASERPYMNVRMPAFKYEALQGWHESVVKLDRRDEMPEITNSQTAEEIAEAGRQCVGNRGLACIKCHRFAGNKGGGIGAIDMLKMTQRLRPQWFYRYLLDPPKYRPGTRMPSSFIEGKSALTTLYEGDPDRQIDAMWQYLSAGTDAEEPEGLRQGAIQLVANKRPLIYRNFFKGVSPRGIGVAYPSEVNLIWDAQQMSLSRLWKNAFIDASLHWVGRGQGSQDPLGDAVITLEPRLPLAVLASPEAAWPKESARELGYQFKGFHLDPFGNPTFKYDLSGIVVTDTPLPMMQSPVIQSPVIQNTDTEPKALVERTLTFSRGDSAPTGELVWLVAEGVIQTNPDGSFNVDDRITIALQGVTATVVKMGSAAQLRAVVPAGVNQVKQTIQW